MHIIKDGRIVADDWRHLADDESLAGPRVTVSYSRWLAEKERLRKEGIEVGVRLSGDDPIEVLAESEDLSRFPLIVIEFPQMSDGRGFSLARLLRERYGYRGEIRARGDFIRDQMFFLSRVGVNAFECGQDQDLESLLPALSEFTVRYQAAADEPQPLYRRRN